MNILDFFILIIISFSVVVGIHQGFVVTLLHTASYLLSWVLALIFYPLVSTFVLNKYPDFFEKIVYYADGSSKIPIVEDRATSLFQFTREGLIRILESTNLTTPFNRILAHNVFNASPQAQTLANYFDDTFGKVIIGIISFLLLFLLLRLIFSMAISIARIVVSLPALKKFDGLFGGCFGLLSSVFVLHFVIALVPIFLTLAPVEVISQYIEDSFLANIFYRTNIFTNFMRNNI